MFLPPLLSCNALSFPFEVILSDWVFKDLRTLDVCLAVLICGDNGISRDPLVVCFGDQLAGSAHEPMHRGWHTFLSWLSGRNFGALFEVLCVGWIDESETVWCISYNHAHGYLRWHWGNLCIDSQGHRTHKLITKTYVKWINRIPHCHHGYPTQDIHQVFSNH